MDLRDVRYARGRQYPDLFVLRTGTRGMKWPDVELGKRYRVNPIRSGNSSSREGQVGEAIEQRESGFGHKWAVLDFEGSGREAVRTVLLDPVEDPEG